MGGCEGCVRGVRGCVWGVCVGGVCGGLCVGWVFVGGCEGVVWGVVRGL